MWQIQKREFKTVGNGEAIDPNLTPLKFKHLVSPAPAYLACFNQEVIAEQTKNVIRNIHRHKAIGFLNETKDFLGQVEKCIGTECLKEFLDLPVEIMWENKEVFLNKVLKELLSLDKFRVDLSKPIFDKIFSHKSAFEIVIEKDPHVDFSETEFGLFINSTDFLFLYNVEEERYPLFLKDWLYKYLQYLGYKIGGLTMREGIEDDYVEIEADRYELDPTGFNDNEIEAFKVFLRNPKELNKDEKQVIDDLVDHLMNTGIYIVPNDEEIEMLIRFIFYYRSHREQAKIASWVGDYTVKWLSDNFSAICTENEILPADQKCIDMIRDQLEILVKLDELSCENCLYDCGDVPMHLALIVDFSSNIFDSEVNLNEYVQTRMGCDESAKFGVDISKENFWEHLHHMIVCEYFCWQLCSLDFLRER